MKSKSEFNLSLEAQGFEHDFLYKVLFLKISCKLSSIKSLN